MHGSRAKRTPSELNIKRAANGGYIVRHHFDNSGAGESYQPPSEHVFSKHKDVMAHLHTHLGAPVSEPDGDEGEVRQNAPGQPAAPTKAAGRRAAQMRGRGVD